MSQFYDEPDTDKLSKGFDQGIVTALAIVRSAGTKEVAEMILAGMVKGQTISVSSHNGQFGDH